MRLAAYEILELLGEGAMARVFRAVPIGGGDPVAIKVFELPPETKRKKRGLRKQESERIEFSKRFRAEAQTLKQLQHPNIIVCHEFGQQGSILFLVLDLVDGKSMKKLIKNSPGHPPQDVVRMMTEVASALDYVHTRNIIHRDVKPDNILLTPQGQVRLLDFGIAKHCASGLPSLTRSFEFIGTPSYSSPEQITGGKLTKKSDLFSLGSLCFELMTGKQPYNGINISQVLFQIVRGEPDLEQDYASLGFDDNKTRFLFEKMLNKDAHRRFESGFAFCEALADAVLPERPRPEFNRRNDERHQLDQGTMKLPKFDANEQS